MQEPCSRHLLPRKGLPRRGTARMRGLAINSIQRGQGLYHRDNAVPERVLGNKGRAAMTLPELEAALAWLERNRLADFLHLLDGDARYTWAARQRTAWRPRTGRGGGRPRQDLRS